MSGGLASLAADNQHVDAVARWLAVAALVVAAGSMFIAWRSYRRGGARVKVMAWPDSVSSLDQQIHYEEIVVDVRNRGLATAQVVRMAVRRSLRRHREEVVPYGELLKYTLPGLDHVRFTLELRQVIDAVGLRTGKSARIRVLVQLGTGHWRRSRSLRVKYAASPNDRGTQVSPRYHGGENV
jgi:hypothetical protein